MYSNGIVAHNNHTGVDILCVKYVSAMMSSCNPGWTAGRYTSGVPDVSEFACATSISICSIRERALQYSMDKEYPGLCLDKVMSGRDPKPSRKTFGEVTLHSFFLAKR